MKVGELCVVVKFRPLTGLILKPIWFFQVLIGKEIWIPNWAISVSKVKVRGEGK